MELFHSCEIIDLESKRVWGALSSFGALCFPFWVSVSLFGVLGVFPSLHKRYNIPLQQISDNHPLVYSLTSFCELLATLVAPWECQGGRTYEFEILMADY